MLSPLRPELYNRLERYSQNSGGVKVVWWGRPVCWGLEINEEGRQFRVINPDNPDHHWGESYRINCPFCDDGKHRLYIGHMWGRHDEVTGTNNLWLAYCQHRNCVTGDNRRSLYNEVFALVPSRKDQDVVLTGKPLSEFQGHGKVEWPGTIWTTDKIPQDHVAYKFLAGRRFNPVWLGKHLNVGYVIEGHGQYGYQITGRLFIPMYMDGELVGWQARLLDDTKKTRENPKYRSLPGMRRGQILYNYDNAKAQKFGVIVEGPTDVWRFGPEAVAVLGGFTGHQAQLISTTWDTAVVLLDADAIDKSHSLFQILRQRGMKVVEVVLPDDRDPADYATKEIRCLVRDTAAQQNIRLDI